MLDIGVQTKGILPEKMIDDGFEQIKRAGFNRVDINVDAFLKNTDVYDGKLNKFFDQDIEDLVAYFNQYKKAMDKRGIKPSQMHAPYPVRVEGKSELSGYMQGTVIPKSIIMAEVLDVPWVVIHPFKMQYLYGKERERQENLQYFKMIVPLLKQCNVRVCFENLYEGIGRRIVEGVCADPDDAVWYVDTLNAFAGEELFGFCLDTGHLQLVKRDPYDFIIKLGNRLKTLHIHENDFVGDLHQVPFSFGSKKDDGQNWDRVCQGLKDIGFEGTLSFETFPALNSFPRSMSDTVLKAIHAVGEYFAQQIERMDSNGKFAL